MNEKTHNEMQELDHLLCRGLAGSILSGEHLINMIRSARDELAMEIEEEGAYYGL